MPWNPPVQIKNPLRGPCRIVYSPNNLFGTDSLESRRFLDICCTRLNNNLAFNGIQKYACLTERSSSSSMLNPLPTSTWSKGWSKTMETIVFHAFLHNMGCDVCHQIKRQLANRSKALGAFVNTSFRYNQWYIGHVHWFSLWKEAKRSFVHGLCLATEFSILASICYHNMN